MRTTTTRDTPDGRRSSHWPAAGSLLRSSVPATDRSGELSNYPTDLLTSPPQDLDASVVAALPPIADTQSPAISEAVSRREYAPVAGAKLSQNYPGIAPKPRLAPEQTATKPVATSLEKSQPTTTAPTAVHLQANQQQTPRSRFTELITAQHLSAWFLFTAAFIAIGLGGLARVGAWPRQDHRRRLSGGFQRNRAPCCSAGHDRYRIAYRRRIRAWSDHVVCFTLHRARATLSLARRFLRDHDCGTRVLYALAPPDRHGHGSFSCRGRSSHSRWMFWKRTADEGAAGESCPNRRYLR